MTSWSTLTSSPSLCITKMEEENCWELIQEKLEVWMVLAPDCWGNVQASSVRRFCTFFSIALVWRNVLFFGKHPGCFHPREPNHFRPVFRPIISYLLSTYTTPFTNCDRRTNRNDVKILHIMDIILFSFWLLFSVFSTGTMDCLQQWDVETLFWIGANYYCLVDLLDRKKGPKVTTESSLLQVPPSSESSLLLLVLPSSSSLVPPSLSNT